MNIRACREIRELFSGYLDGAISGQEMLAISRHVEGYGKTAGCAACAEELAQWTQVQRTVTSLGAVKAPADLALRLRLAISHEAAKREETLLNRLALLWQNTIRPVTLQVTAGVASSVVLLGSMLALMNMVGVAPAVEAKDEPLGAVTQPHYLYSMTMSEAVETPYDSPIVVEASIDKRGRVYDYKIVAGPSDTAIRTQLETQLLGSIFQPASAFGVPIRGRAILTFSGVMVRG